MAFLDRFPRPFARPKISIFFAARRTGAQATVQSASLLAA
jgi:hypothetical protein